VFCYFVKKLLSLPPNTPSFFIYSEFGYAPISRHVITQAVNLWAKIADAHPDSLLHNCYVSQWGDLTCPNNWAGQLYELLNSFLPAEVWHSVHPTLIRDYKAEIILKYVEGFKLEQNNRLIQSVIAPFYKSIFDPLGDVPRSYTLLGLPIRTAGLVARIRSNSLNLYICDFKLSRSNYCILCNNLIENNWNHIFAQCSQLTPLRRKHHLNNWFTEILSPSKDFCLRTHSYIREVSSAVKALSR